MPTLTSRITLYYKHGGLPEKHLEVEAATREEAIKLLNVAVTKLTIQLGTESTYRITRIIAGNIATKKGRTP